MPSTDFDESQHPRSGSGTNPGQFREKPVLPQGGLVALGSPEPLAAEVVEDVETEDEYLGYPVVDGYLVMGDGGRTDLRATHRCGHVLKARGESMYSWQKYHASDFTEMVCYRCHRATLEASEAAKSAGLPALTGSPKQITWALTIRDRVLAAVTAESGDDAAAAISAHTDSSWWIDHRSTPAYKLAQEYGSAKKEEENPQATESVELPALTGSPKQIAYAETLRSKAINEYDAYATARLARLKKGRPNRQDELAKMQAVYDEVRAWLVSKTDAAWYIKAFKGAGSNSVYYGVYAYFNLELDNEARNRINWVHYFSDN